MGQQFVGGWREHIVGKPPFNRNSLNKVVVDRVAFNSIQAGSTKCFAKNSKQQAALLAVSLNIN